MNATWRRLGRWAGPLGILDAGIFRRLPAARRRNRRRRPGDRRGPLLTEAFWQFGFEPLESRRVLSGVTPTLSDIGDVVVVGHTKYFSATNDATGFNDLYKDDGSGPVLVDQFDVSSRPTNPQDLTVCGESLFYTDYNPQISLGTELWRTDLVSGRTAALNSFYDGSLASGPYDLTDVNGTLFFAAWDPFDGIELWSVPPGGAAQVHDIFIHAYEVGPGDSDGNSNPSELTAAGGRLYFAASRYDPTSPTLGERGLWMFDTQNPNPLLRDVPTLVKDFSPNADLSHFNVIDGELYFSVASPSGWQLWKSDGTAAGTVLVGHTFTVLNTNDSGYGSLRQAILDANASPGSDEIAFAIPRNDPGFVDADSQFTLGDPNPDVFVIKPLTPLPALADSTGGTIINGATQTAFTGDTNPFGPEIVLDGSAAGWGNGLTIWSNNNQIMGLDIANFPQMGIEISGSSYNRIAGCYIGVDATGTKADGNGYRGVFVWNGAHNVIGGTTAADRNVISGARNWEGVGIFGGNSNAVEDDYIGTDATGTKAIGNAGRGIDIENSYDNTVGGTAAGSGNVISGNAQEGVGIYGAASTGDVVQGNYIGVDATGEAALGNGYTGVLIWGGASSNFVGGAGPGARNVIAGNGYLGVWISGSGTTGNQVFGNYVGTNAAGTAALPNANDGVGIDAGAVNNTVGGPASGQGNLISGNARFGIEINGSGTQFNTVAGNYIGTDASGNAAIPNLAGIAISWGASQNTIGGVNAGEQNVISGNRDWGVFAYTAGDQNQMVGNLIGTNASGAAALGNGSGVIIDGTNGVIRNNVISANLNVGVYLYAAQNTLVAGNRIGTNENGDAALPNGVIGPGFEGTGVLILAGRNDTIGGTTAADRNIISGNLGNGIALLEGSANTVEGNYIGTDVTGAHALANGTGGGTMYSDYAKQDPLGSKTAGILVAYAAYGNTIGGSAPGAANVISANAGSGVDISQSNIFGFTYNSFHNVVEGNFIGTDATGTSALGNAGSGVTIDGCSDNTIGGAAAGDGNIISGNLASGVTITGSRAKGNVVEGNDLGTDASGETALGNGSDGIAILGGASGNVIGGSSPAARNVISGNGWQGVDIIQAGTNNNLVAGNYIGVDAAGTKALGNRNDGVAIWAGAQNNIVGTNGDGISDALERNVISGNGRHGVDILNAGTNDNVVAGNLIGTDVTGAVALGNGVDGVAIYAGAQGNRVGTNGDGISDSLERNVISANGWQGVDIIQAGTNNNVVAGNYIGVDAAGTKALGNRNDGVAIWAGAQNNIVGTNGDGIGDAAERNIISGNGNHGVEILQSGTNDNVVAGNLIGTDVSGTQALGNHFDGVAIWQGAQNNRVGTNGDGISDALERNVISGNGRNGVDLVSAGTTNNVVAGNLIGTDVTGEMAVPNVNWGVNITAGASGNFIGVYDNAAAAAAERNVISGNGFDGVQIAQPGTDYNVVAGNLIGTDAQGIKAMGNYWGVKIVAGAAHNRIGTNADGVADDLERNVISGNRSDGIFVTDSGTQYNTIAGNYIGTDVTGETAVPNVNWGVNITAGASSNFIGVYDNAAAAAAERNVISGNGFDGVQIAQPGTDYNVVAGNLIGTDAQGIKAMGNYWGVKIVAGAAHNRIGTNADGVADDLERNVISGNRSDGIFVTDAGTQYNTIAGNYIGTDVTGSKPLGNARRGVTIGAGATNNTIGGTTAAARNVISGNGWEGVAFDGASGNALEGNYIGTDASGTAALPNTFNGVILHAGASNDVIGAPDAGNVISGNDQSGIALFDAATTGNSIEGNLIGTNAAGTGPLGNLFAGVGIVADASHNTVGGTGAGQGNAIAFNGWSGVLVAGAGASGNAIRGNSIYSNLGLGIDLGGDGVTADDPLDADSGPNGLQNFPVLDFARAGAKTLVSGAFNGAPNATFVLDFYASGAVDPSGYGEGQRWLGAIAVTTDGNGNADFSGLLAGSTGSGDYISATATDADGNTSEFSLTLTLDHTAPTSAVDPLPVRAASLSFPVSVAGSDPDTTGQVTSGVRAYDLYVSVDGGPFAYWTTVPAGSPSAVFTAQSSHLYAFRSVASDDAGNVETKPVAVEASIYVPDLDPPVSHVDSVDASSPRFTVDFSAADTGGSGLRTIGVFVQVDGAAPEQIAGVNAAGSSSYSGSVEYQALEDGVAHDYRFYTVAVDRNDNVEAAPSAPSDVELDNVLYSVPATLQVAGFVVEQGAAERSFIRYLEIDFNRNVAGELQTIVATLKDGNPADDRMSLTRYDLSGKNPVDATSALAGASIQVIGQAILIDFGANGIGGNRNSNVGDGYYTLAFDLDDNLTNGLEATDSFYRLFGDTNGDRTVNAADLANITAAFGQNGAGLNADINGDDVVNILDRLYASRELGRTLDGSLHLDD